MILQYIYNVLKFKKWKLLSLITITVTLKWSAIVIFRPSISHLTELHKCPACFGTSACDYIHEVDVKFHDFYSIFVYFFGVKNVFFGSFKNHKVVLKKLAQSFELDEFDRMLCENKNLSGLCLINPRETDNEINANFQELIEREISLNFTKDNFSRLRLCPTVQRINNLLEPVYHNNRDIDRKALEISIWVLTVINPEPLLLQLLSADEDWPVPKYYGACGRIIIEEYIGLPLTAFYSEPWLHRAKIASNLLDAANQFTHRNANFGFYLTDISADNIAVDLNYNVKFVDLENIIVVDKNIAVTERSTEWNQLHVNNEGFSCPECLAFSSVEICSHKISDHNYYAICKTLLALDINNTIFPGGLLHDMPTDILENYPNVQHFIQQCFTPQTPFNRINAGMQLKELLDYIIVQKRYNR